MAEPIGLASEILTLATFALQCSVSLYETVNSLRSHQNVCATSSANWELSVTCLMASLIRCNRTLASISQSWIYRFCDAEKARYIAPAEDTGQSIKIIHKGFSYQISHILPTCNPDEYYMLLCHSEPIYLSSQSFWKKGDQIAGVFNKSG